jgi:hypothetical protein
VVSGSRIVLLVIGLRYEIKVWRELWPRIRAQFATMLLNEMKARSLTALIARSADF